VAVFRSILAITLLVVEPQALCATPVQATAPKYRLIRSLSGPSGKVEASRYVIDEVRSKFVVPPDRTIVILFEWEGPAGRHELSGIWKRPDGRTAAISPIQMDVRERRFSAYWTNTLDSQMEAGIWELEVRIDGEPAGSHPFEVKVTEAAAPPVASLPAVPARRMPSMDELFALRRSLVWIHKLDAQGRRVDTSTGFVIRPGQVATAFQSIDGASKLALEFSDGRRTESSDLLAWNRLQDWAVIKADTAAVAALPVARSEPVPIGDRLIAFHVEGQNVRVIGGVDVTARYNPAPFGERLRVDPTPAAQATGGPLLNGFGDVAAVIGGSVLPGLRPAPGLQTSSWPPTRYQVNDAAIPIRLVPDLADASAGTSLQSIAARGEFTAFLESDVNLTNAGTTREMSKDTKSTEYVHEFRPSDATVAVFSIWQERLKRKGPQEVLVKVYDLENRERVRVKPVKLKMAPHSLVQITTAFSPSGLPAGLYRVDLLNNGTPVWRTTIVITE